MKTKIFVILVLIFGAGVGFAQGFGTNYLPVYLCPNSCFELDIAHDTLNPGYVYDSVYVFSRLESLATGSSGRWYPLPDTAAPLPQICNNAYFDAGRGEWVFGWDSVYIRADTNGFPAAETTIWVFHYPPDSGWVSAGGTTLCPAVAGTLFGKYLEVRGAFFWSFVVDTAVVANDFAHPEIIDTTICIRPDHQAYWAPDTFSLSPTYIDTTYDPCPSLICTTFTLLPTDPVPDTTIIACRDFPNTVILTSSYPYDHNWIYNGAVILHSTGTEDTLEITPTVCGTSWVYYEITGSGACAAARIDSVAVWAPCSEYEIVLTSSMPHDSGESYCAGETLTLCLSGENFDSADVCWDLPGAYLCGKCVQMIADTSAWVYINAADTFGCLHTDSVYVPVNPPVEFEFFVSKGCLGEELTFTVAPDSSVSADYAIIQFGDGTWEYVDTFDSAGNFVATHRYDSAGVYVSYATLYDSAGCSRTDSVWVRQTEIVAHLTVDENPACLGGEIYLDASLSAANPSGDLIYHFYDPAGDSVYFGDLPHCVDTLDSAGVWYVWVIDTAAGCSSYAAISVQARWVEVFAPGTVLALSGCERCLGIGAVPHNCGGEIDFGYAKYDPATGNLGAFVPLDSSLFCVPGSGGDGAYYLYGWCSECPDSRDSALVSVRRVDVNAVAYDTFVCYGQPMPNVLDSVNISPAYAADSLWIQVVFSREGGGVDTVVRWSRYDSLPAQFDWYPVPGNGILTYSFALEGAYECTQDFSARITIDRPVAVLEVAGGGYSCITRPLVLDASASYSNCTGPDFCYRYFEDFGGVLLPLDSACCGAACDSFTIAAPTTGAHIYAVQVCMQDVPWCCDTAYDTVFVCDTVSPVVGVYGECSPETFIAGRTAEFYVLNADSFESFEWNVITADSSGTTTVFLGDSSAASFVPSVADTFDSLVVQVCAYRCENACTTCASIRYWLDYPPAAAPVALVAYEDSCPFVAYLGDSVSDREGDSLVFSVLSGPADVEVTPAGTLYWDCPTNCDVGGNEILVLVSEAAGCGAACTLTVSVDVMNTFAGIVGFDSSAGFSCVDSAAISAGSISVYVSSGCGDYVGFKLLGGDVDECDCGFWSADELFWLDVNPSGMVNGDVYTVPRGAYTDTIYYSDCHDTAGYVVSINIPNHPPRAATVPFDLWIPRGGDTVAVSADDFVDIDGDAVSFLNYSITNSGEYSVINYGSYLRVMPSANYTNFPGVPDTLAVVADDGFGGQTEAKILVWVYNPTEIEPEHRKPQTTTIVGAYPNPFNSSVAIEVENAARQKVRMYVVNEGGRIVRQLFDAVMPVGVYRIIWDGTDSDGGMVPSGRYWVVFAAEDERYSLPVQVIR